ncbi:MAG: ATP-binding protein [Candidatus Riflebacteria bacterium]|nr:ATP-binding protein [Candidatus Riflebacteria bacterium]
MIYRKKYMDKIIPFIDAKFIKVLTGIRRSGKSTILQMIREYLVQKGVNKKNILFYRFDSIEYENLTSHTALFNELKSQLSSKNKTYIFLDEIQEVPNWEKVVNSLMSDYDVDIYVTGSNSRMMSSEISTYLTGRYVSFMILPLTFSEYLDFRKTKGKIKSIKEEFARYLRYGGFPAIHLSDYTEEEAYTIVRDIYNSTIFTDIVKRSQIRKVDQLERVIKYAFDNVGQTFSALTLSKYIKSQGRNIDTETLYSYLNKLEKAYILHRCSRYDIKGKEFLKTQEKFYLADVAFRYSVLGYSSRSVSAMIENIVYLELLSRDYRVSVGKIGDTEIDFVASKNGSKIYIQVCYQINSKETNQREYGRLLSIKDNYPKYVLRMDDFAEGDYEGIKTLHVADFLLNNQI